MIYRGGLLDDLSWMKVIYRGYTYKPLIKNKLEHQIEMPSGGIMHGPWGGYFSPTISQIKDFIDEAEKLVNDKARQSLAWGGPC
jgi:hypothetical protein